MENDELKSEEECEEDDEEYLPPQARKERKRVFSCDKCDVKCNSVPSLKAHYKSEHGTGRGKNIYPCSKCYETFTNEKLLRKHRKTHKKQPEDTKHYEYSFDEESGVYTCNSCEMECSEKERMEDHLNTHSEKYSCNVCNEAFDDLYKHSCHVYEHEYDVYPCAVCNYTSARRTSILSHIKRIHLNQFTYHCQHCGKGFNDCKLYKEHENTHDDNAPKFDCVVCQKSFPYSRYLYTHQVRYHRCNIEGTLMDNQCAQCYKVFAKMSSLMNHMKQHEAAEKVHEKKHLCDVCGKGYARPDKLKIHYRIHTGYKPYVCSYCTKSFIKKEYLVMHERIHNGEKPYSCEYCGKCFNQGAPLRIHVRSHTGERPYICHLCDSGFVSKGALNLHLKSCPGKESTVE